jgi:hypothetical protein
MKWNGNMGYGSYGGDGNHPALTQGLFYVITGLWPLISMRTFLRVTGSKTDLWLVKIVGVLVLVIGLVLLLAWGRQQVSLEIALLAGGIAGGLAAADLVYVSKRVIGPVYLLDAAAEVALVLWWVVTGLGLL